LIALCFDTALSACSVAVGDERTLRAARYEEREAGQAERLVPMIEETLREAAVPAAALSRIGITVGPGSFTGTRIGLAAARAMGLALGIPVFGITSLEALAAGAPPDCAVLSAIDARRGQIYAQLFARRDSAGQRRALTAPLALSLEEVASSLPGLESPLALLGSAANMLAPLLPRDRFTIAQSGATTLFPVAADFLPAIARMTDIPAAMPRPLYLRAADAIPRSHP
jgi:tRNA threonylcarbamoyladenosine biosynthesis protein TsaB